MPSVCVQLTGEHGEQTHQEIYATVAARPTSLPFARDSMSELHEAGSIDETFADAFCEEKSDNSTEKVVVLTSTSQNIS